jgi:hypothetical protein
LRFHFLVVVFYVAAYNKIENTWKMTWDVVEIWDANKSNTIPPNNTGIEGATEGEVNKLKYKLTSNDLSVVTFF